MDLLKPPSVADSPELRFTLQTARAWGVSPSVFMGREIRTTITYEYDVTGVRSIAVATQEPLWTEEDRAMAMELQDYEAGLCPGCGTPLAETTKAEHEFAYVAKDPIRCHRCTASQRAMTAHEDKPQASALSIPVVLRGTS